MSRNEAAKLAAARRLATLPSSQEADDLVWASTCKEWIDREYAPTALLNKATKMLRSGDHLPSHLANWLADAFEAAMLKPPETQAKELARELGVGKLNKPRKRLPNGRILRLMHGTGMSMGDLARHFKVGKTTISDRMKEDIASPKEVADIVRGIELIECTGLAVRK